MRTKAPFFSVIIPMYNEEKYIRDCLDSIISQSFNDFEVIIVDNSSTDFSPNICKEYLKKDSRIKYLKKENRGSCQSRIYGAERARGTYILFCVSDDYYADNKAFEILFNTLKDEKYSVAQFGLLAKHNHIKRKISSVKSPKIINNRQFINSEYPKLLCSFWEESHILCSVCNKAYHHSNLSKLPRSYSVERIFWGDDQVINLFLTENCTSFILIPQFLYCYRIGVGGTNRFSPYAMEDLNLIKKYQLSFLEKHSGENIEKIKYNLFYEVANWIFLFAQQAIQALGANEALAIIQDSLDLENIKAANNYFKNLPEHNNEQVIKLIISNNAENYIQAAHEYIKKNAFKNKLLSFIKYIYHRI